MADVLKAKRVIQDARSVDVIMYVKCGQIRFGKLPIIH